MLANIVFDTFLKGGPIMWPLLVTLLIALSVVCERVFWWARERHRREPEKLEHVFTALERGDYQEASRISKDSSDPVVRTIWHGLNHVHSSMEGALQVAAGIEIQRAGRFVTIMDTIVTLAPLLGLLGTVTGIMHAFKFVGNEELAAIKVSGGISEALIATACGLGIAIFTLIPFNYFSGKVARFQFELETAINNVIVLVASAKQRGYDTGAFVKEGKVPTL